jgi:hypothetical protein
MRYLLMAAALCGLVSACSVRSERTVVERPAAAVAVPATSVVYTDPPPATTTTVRVGP